MDDRVEKATDKTQKPGTEEEVSIEEDERGSSIVVILIPILSISIVVIVIVGVIIIKRKDTNEKPEESNPESK